MPGKFIKKLGSASSATVRPEPSSTPAAPLAESSKVSPSPIPLTPLEPLDLTKKKAPKKKRGKASRLNLKKKRENKHAVLIQSKWRGHCARKSIHERKLEKEAEKDQAPREDNAEEERLEGFQQIPFRDIRRVKFCVDSAVGLPVTCTATRVSCRLLQQDRTPVSEPGEAFSDPEAPVASPEYDLFMTWKSSSLHPSYTLLCRVDTLDRVALEPKTVGYAALKLCSAPDGSQPAPDAPGAPESRDHLDAFLNAGRFRVPLLQGRLPDWCPLTEERLEDLPVLPDAFLTVRLFDASAEEPPKQKRDYDKDLDADNCDGRVATVLYGTYDNLKVANRMRKEGKPDLPLWKDLGEDLKLGNSVESEEWSQLRPLFIKWLINVFPPVSQMSRVVNPNYSVRFKDTDDAGVLVGLDMLYNMPIVRPRDLPPNSVVGYKTVLQYLRGSRAPWPPEADPADDPRYILDDVSQCWDFECSTARCPVFTDDFKLVSNMHLGPNACVLLIVTRVDVTFTTDTSYDLKMPFRQPHRSWWGLLPLRAPSPFSCPAGSSLADKECDGAFVNAGTHQVPLFEGIPPVAVMESENPLQTTIDSLRRAESEFSSGGCPCSCMGPPDALPHDTFPDEFEEPVFSRSGASAIVRLQDSRLAQFATEHIKVTSSILPNTHLLEQLLSSQAHASHRKCIFAYDAFKYDLEKPTAVQIIPAILKEPQLLLDGINFKSEADCLEYIDNVPSM